MVCVAKDDPEHRIICPEHTAVSIHFVSYEVAGRTGEATDKSDEASACGGSCQAGSQIFYSPRVLCMTQFYKKLSVKIGRG